MSEPDSALSRKMEINTIGRSVKRGARAIKIPFSLFPLSVSETTRDNKGPGAIPAARPREMPYIKYSIPALLDLRTAGRS